MTTQKKSGSSLSVILGLAVACLFLFLTFRNLDFKSITEQMSRVPLGMALLMFALASLAVLSRGLRWWLLLPKPRIAGELWSAQRAMAISYGINNVASRVGEVARVVIFGRDTGRDMALTASTVVADRILFDFLMFAALTAFSLLGFREQLMTAFPQLAQVLPVFALGITVGIIGLLLLAFKPDLFTHILVLLQLPRLPKIWAIVEGLVTNISRGLEVMKQPRQLVFLLAYNLPVWGLAIVNFHVALEVFDIQVGVAETVMLFTVASFGVVLPSPGGLGTFHYFLTIALVNFYGVEEATAAATATVAHGINFIALTAMAVFFWLLPRPVTNRLNPNPDP